MPNVPDGPDGTRSGHWKKIAKLRRATAKFSFRGLLKGPNSESDTERVAQSSWHSGPCGTGAGPRKNFEIEDLAPDSEKLIKEG